MAKPEMKLVTQLMVLVSRASLGEESLLVQVAGHPPPPRPPPLLIDPWTT